MKNGIDRFEYWLIKVESALVQSTTEINPGLWLYTNDLRTPLFMLESLSKLYEALHNKSRFSKMKDDFKLLEDALGAIDYYDSFVKEFSSDSTIPVIVVDYLQAQKREKIQRFNDLLQERKWIGENATRIKKIRKKLADADWLKDEKEIKEIALFYQEAIDEINSFVAETNCKFTEIETQVHELRRKLRWLSIYPRALQGTIQLTQKVTNDENLTKYLTEEVITSPFNKMPDAGINRYFLILEKDYFLALSWMIAELGKLKDNGLKITAVSEAFEQTKSISKPEALALTYQALGNERQTMAGILLKSSAICEAYFKEKNLDKLISGISNIS